MTVAPPGDGIVVRPFQPTDAGLRERIARRLHPGQTVSPRDPSAVTDYLERFGRGELDPAEGGETFVGELNGVPAGHLVLHPEADPFTGHSRAYVDVLVVAEEAEGGGVAGALMRFAEGWAAGEGCREVCLDVFAGNGRAISFYEHAGYRPDHIRMAKPLDPTEHAGRRPDIEGGERPKADT
jgi:GNAT superfamily N-acetyltransferase